MGNSLDYFRSPHLLSVQDTAIVVIDVQEKLLPTIPSGDLLLRKIDTLIQGAQILGLPILVTEQYPQGLGATVPQLASVLGGCDGVLTSEKTHFSCRECETEFRELTKRGIQNLVIVGIETHVCVAQSALDLLANGFDVHVCVDAVGARNSIDHQTALRRLENNGVSPTTVEAVLFELCEHSKRESFKAISALIKGS